MQKRTAFLLVALTAVLSVTLTSCGETAAAGPKNTAPKFTKFSTYDFQMGRIVCIYINPDNNSNFRNSAGAVGTVSCVTDGGS
jgi:hypothetical protein